MTKSEGEPTSSHRIAYITLLVTVVLGLPTFLLNWKQFVDYPEPEQATTVKKQTVPASQAGAPSPNRTTESPKKDVVIAATPPPPQSQTPPAEPVTIAPAPEAPRLQKLCPNPQIPKTVESLTTADRQICAISACAGEATTDDVALDLVLDWRVLAKKVAIQPCQYGDWKALSNAVAFKNVIEAVSQALDETSLPEPADQRNACRSLQNMLTQALINERGKLSAPDSLPRGCPPSGEQVSGDVAAFLERYNFR